MHKKALTMAAGTSAGTTIGAVIIPRLTFTKYLNDYYPPIWKQALMWFAVTYVLAYVLYLLFD